MTPGDKPKYELLGVNKMVRKMFQKKILIDELLMEVEKYMLEIFKLTENIKETDKISINNPKGNSQHYKKTKKTALSIAQLHFGHYKAAALEDELSVSHSKILHILFKLCQSLSIWKQGLTVMLKK